MVGDQAGMRENFDLGPLPNPALLQIRETTRSGKFLRVPHFGNRHFPRQKSQDLAS